MIINAKENSLPKMNSKKIKIKESNLESRKIKEKLTK